jgi:4-hydroxybenzoyl-CoA thioesterase
MATHHRQIRIARSDCDPAGIVYDRRYLVMLDASTVALFRKVLGMTKPQILKHYGIVGTPTVETRAIFHQRSTFGDDVAIESTVAELRRSIFNVHHTEVWGGRHPQKVGRIEAQEIPADVLKRFAQFKSN